MITSAIPNHSMDVASAGVVTAEDDRKITNPSPTPPTKRTHAAITPHRATVLAAAAPRCSDDRRVEVPRCSERDAADTTFASGGTANIGSEGSPLSRRVRPVHCVPSQNLRVFVNRGSTCQPVLPGRVDQAMVRAKGRAFQ